jgi:alpha-tubulin suppressor-like RCC1 family protein
MLVDVRHFLLVASLFVIATAIPAAADTTTGHSSTASSITAGDGYTCAVTSGGAAKCWGRNDLGQLGNGTRRSRSIPAAVHQLAGGVVALSAGDHHACALTRAGAVKCWGFNRFGQLGDGTTWDDDRLAPVGVIGLGSGVSAVAAGHAHTCALTSAGAVKCWGSNRYGQLGDATQADRRTPVDVWGLASGVAAITAGFAHTCALMTSGAVKCWGANWSGQLGNGSGY